MSTTGAVNMRSVPSAKDQCIPVIAMHSFSITYRNGIDMQEVKGLA